MIDIRVVACKGRTGQNDGLQGLDGSGTMLVRWMSGKGKLIHVSQGD